MKTMFVVALLALPMFAADAMASHSTVNCTLAHTVTTAGSAHTVGYGATPVAQLQNFWVYAESGARAGVQEGRQHFVLDETAGLDFWGSNGRCVWPNAAERDMLLY